jgi:hypothetical protein
MGARAVSHVAAVAQALDVVKNASKIFSRGGYPRESFDSRAAFGVLLGCVSVFGVRSHDERTGPLEAKGGFEGNEGGQAGRSDGKRV